MISSANWTSGRPPWTTCRGGLPKTDFVVLAPRDGAGPNISLDRVPSTVQVPPRIHLDLYSEQQDRDVDRLLRLGASRVEWSKRPADADYVILADPEGNRFCVVDTAGR